MYVTSLVTEFDVVKGEKYLLSYTKANGISYVIDGKGEEYALFDYEWAYVKDGEVVDILRERIEALQEENAELKSRMASLEK